MPSLETREFERYCEPHNSSCFASPPFAAEKIRMAVRNSSIRSVFLATDANVSERTEMVSELKRIGLDVQSPMKSSGDTDRFTRPFQNQLKCSQATSTVLNRHSAFSTIILALRFARHRDRMSRDMWL